ncbi:MAG: helix-turn-helix domain-containing protein [Ignavibacteria bacterium]
MKALRYTTSEKKLSLILEKLDIIEAKLKESNFQIMNIDEAAKYLSFKKSYLYKMTCCNDIPFYKPGKKVYFNKVDLDNWILSHRRKSNEEIQKEADEYIRTHPWKN